MQRKKSGSPGPLLPLMLLCALCVGVYANVLHGEFVWDDHLQVVRNSSIRSVDNIPRAFVTPLWSFMYSQANAENHVFDRYYRPLQTVIYIIAYQIDQLSPFIYHLTNLILHTAATLMVYLLCLQLGLPSLASFFAAALFGAHPVHTEAVSWIAGVGDLSCAIFYFAGLLMWLRYLEDRRSKWIWLSAASFLIGLFSKEMAVTLPIVAALLILTMPKERRLKLNEAALSMVPFVAAAVIYALLRIISVGLTPPAAVHENASMLDWVTLGITVLGNYFRYVIAPYPLYMYHLIPLNLQNRLILTSIYATVLIGVGVLCWISRRRVSIVAIWCAIFVATLAPVMYFKGIGGGVFFAERYLYIPSVAAVILAGFGLARLSRTQAMAIGIGIVAVFAMLTIARNRDWQVEERIYVRTLRYEPEAVNIRTSLAEIYLRREENDAARDEFQRSLQYLQAAPSINDMYEAYRIYLGLGTAAARQGKPAEAIDDLKKALQYYPQGDGAMAQLGGVLLTWGHDPAEAIAMLRKAVEISAVNELARDYLGVALVNQGHFDEGIEYFREALKLNPDLGSAKQHLELALQAKSQH